MDELGNNASETIVWKKEDLPAQIVYAKIRKKGKCLGVF